MLAPSLRHVADSLSLSWRRQLTAVAHKRYLRRINFYTVSQLAGMQVRPRRAFEASRYLHDLPNMSDMLCCNVALVHTGPRAMP